MESFLYALISLVCWNSVTGLMNILLLFTSLFLHVSAGKLKYFNFFLQTCTWFRYSDFPGLRIWRVQMRHEAQSRDGAGKSVNDVQIKANCELGIRDYLFLEKKRKGKGGGANSFMFRCTNSPLVVFTNHSGG